MGDCAGGRLGIGTNKTEARHLLAGRRPAIPKPPSSRAGRSLWTRPRCRQKPPACRSCREASRRHGVADANALSPRRYSQRRSTLGALRRRPCAPCLNRPKHRNGVTSLVVESQAVEQRADMRVENKDVIGFVHRACGRPRFDDRQGVCRNSYFRLGASRTTGNP